MQKGIRENRKNAEGRRREGGKSVRDEIERMKEKKRRGKLVILPVGLCRTVSYYLLGEKYSPVSTHL